LPQIPDPVNFLQKGTIHLDAPPFFHVILDGKYWVLQRKYIPMIKRFQTVILLCLDLLFKFGSAFKNIPSPKSHFGFDIGDDYKPANFFSRLRLIFKKVADAS